MSNYNDMSKNKKYELDDMNIRSHLNTSLDKEGISVSEELITRTLAAIKEQQALRAEQGTTKINPWSRYIRGFAGVAAALLLAVVGYNVIKQMPIVRNETTSKDSASPEADLMMEQSTSSEAKADMAAKEVPAAANTTADMNAAKDGDQSVLKENEEYTIKKEDDEYGQASIGSADNIDSQNGNDNLTTSIPEDITDAQEFSTSLRVTGGSAATYTFRDIFLPAPEEAQYITISSNKYDTSITLTALEDIKAFYLVMDSYQFTGDNQAAMDEQDYTVEMENLNNQTIYTMYIGSKLIVKINQGDNVSENIYYPDDDIHLKQDIETFLQEYRE